MEKIKLDRKLKTPVYLQLRDMLKMEIQGGRYLPGDMIPSEESLAEKYGISRMTARAALVQLEKDRFVSKASGHRRTVAVSGTPEQSVMDGGNTPAVKTVAFYPFKSVYFDDRFYFAPLFDGICAGTSKHNSMLRFLPEDAVDKDDPALSLKVQGIAGVLFCSSEKKLVPVLKKLYASGFPVVQVNSRHIKELPYIGVNHYKGAYDLLNSLVHFGHRDIAYISWPVDDFFFTRERFRAYREIHKKYSLRFKEENIIQICHPDSRIPAMIKDLNKKLPALFKKKSYPSAIFMDVPAITDELIKELRRIGLDVPRDVSLVATSRNDRDFMLDVTHLDQPLTQMGELASEKLIAMLESSRTENFSIKIDPFIVPGETCAFLNKGI